jgi:PAS domain S-box-containing protein
MSDLNQLARELAALQQQLAQRSRSLEEAESRYDAVFNSALSLMSICTTDGVLLDVNRATLRALGLPIEAFVGQRLWESPWFAENPPEAAKVKAAIRRRRGQFVEYESHVRFRNGEWRVCEFALRPYRSFLGGEARFLVFEVRDLTAERARLLDRRALEVPARISPSTPILETEGDCDG